MRKIRRPAVLTRRDALSTAAGIGVSLVLGRNGRAGAKEPSDAKVCVLTPEATEGPFYFDPKLVRSDITEGKQGAPVVLTLQIVEANDCAPLQDARVDVWHADGQGRYSGSYARRQVPQSARRSCAERNSPGLMERCASIRSIPGGIQAAHPIFTSRRSSATAT
jgi:hypothetical protein